MMEFKCDNCGRIFNKKSHLKQHKNKKNPCSKKEEEEEEEDLEYKELEEERKKILQDLENIIKMVETTQKNIRSYSRTEKKYHENKNNEFNKKMSNLLKIVNKKEIKEEFDNEDKKILENKN